MRQIISKSLLLYSSLFFTLSFLSTPCVGNSLRHIDSNQDDQNHLKLQPISSTKRQQESNLNILALGGSVTWGSQLSSRDLAYPSLLADEGPYDVHNLAIPATDSYYPSLCIQSLLKGRESIEFDVILLEFSLNGFTEFATLVKRLQYRYPNAALVYVHLYSLIATTEPNPDGSLVWSRKIFLLPKPYVKELMDDVGAYTYVLPHPQKAKNVKGLFASDNHHLNERGHQFVANDLLDLLAATSFNKTVPENKDQFKWGEGDQCENWFESGEVKGIVVKDYAEGNMLPMNSVKYTMEFRESGNITINNLYNHTVPVYITYMKAHDMYPITNIKIGDRNNTINPENPLYHCSATKAVGWATPGNNTLIISPTTESKKPFRLVGVALFGFANNMHLPFLHAHNKLGNLNEQANEW